MSNVSELDKAVTKRNIVNSNISSGNPETPPPKGLRLYGLDLGGAAARSGAAVAAGQVRLALLAPLPQGGHEAPPGQSVGWSVEQGCHIDI